MLVKHLVNLIIIHIFLFAAFAQNQGSSRELSTEESYLPESVEIMVIWEQSRAPNRETKLSALTRLDAMIERGYDGEELISILDFLGAEGSSRRVSENIRQVNNFSDVRSRAAVSLGKIGTAEAKDVLIKMSASENDPSVLVNIARSLGTIGMNERSETTRALSLIVSRNMQNPDNVLGLAVLDAIELIAANNEGFLDSHSIMAVMRIIEGNYMNVVKNRALALRSDLWRVNVN